ncbi:MAG: TOBE-like domain-containing protein [Pseudomonadota bacterium]|nr:TOBE-like domain-containing protein [Pseudomonadota bacterium]
MPSEVYDLPTSAFVHRFLGQVNELPVQVREGRWYVGPVDISSPIEEPDADGPSGAAAGTAAAGATKSIALIRPHEIEIGPYAAGWAAVVIAVRVIGPIVRLELCAEGQPANEPLEAEISRERYETERYIVGQKVGLRFRRWQVYPAASGAAA